MSKNLKVILIVSVILIIVSPFVLTRESLSNCFSFVKTGQIGDTIGGIIAPVIGIVSIYLLARTLNEQLKFNFEQSVLMRRDQFKTTFFQLLEEQREIQRSLTTNYIGVSINNPSKLQKAELVGRNFFKMSKYVLRKLFESMESTQYYSSYDKKNIEDWMCYLDGESESYFVDGKNIEHSFTFEDLVRTSNYKFINERYRISEEEHANYKTLSPFEQVKFVYSKFFNIHEDCGNYFRHLYRILYFVEQSEKEELHNVKDDNERNSISKRYSDLCQFVQAQMSTLELFLVFYNSFSFPKLRKLLAKYNILENLTEENLIDKKHNCIREYHLKNQLTV